MLRRRSGGEASTARFYEEFGFGGWRTDGVLYSLSVDYWTGVYHVTSFCFKTIGRSWPEGEKELSYKGPCWAREARFVHWLERTRGLRGACQ